MLLLSGCLWDKTTTETTVVENQVTITTGTVETPIEIVTGSTTTGQESAVARPIESAVTRPTSSKTITLADIAIHNTESDCQTVINGTIYDVTAYFGKHPGGDKNLLRVCGIDATQAFSKQHGSNQKVNNILAGFEIGALTK